MYRYHMTPLFGLGLHPALACYPPIDDLENPIGFGCKDRVMRNDDKGLASGFTEVPEEVM